MRCSGRKDVGYSNRKKKMSTSAKRHIQHNFQSPEEGSWRREQMAAEEKKKISHRPRSIAWELIPFEAL